jgi:hypothetical protein
MGFFWIAGRLDQFPSLPQIDRHPGKSADRNRRLALGNDPDGFAERVKVSID